MRKKSHPLDPNDIFAHEDDARNGFGLILTVSPQSGDFKADSLPSLGYGCR
jgi:hypothetical protein